MTEKPHTIFIQEIRIKEELFEEDLPDDQLSDKVILQVFIILDISLNLMRTCQPPVVCFVIS